MSRILPALTVPEPKEILLAEVRGPGKEIQEAVHAAKVQEAARREEAVRPEERRAAVYLKDGHQQVRLMRGAVTVQAEGVLQEEEAGAEAGMIRQS